MINEIYNTYQYLKPESDTCLKSHPFPSDKKISDIVLDLNYLKAINNSILDILLDLNKYQISKGYCMVVVKSDLTDFPKLDFLIIVPTLGEAEDYIQMEKIQRDLGV